VANVLSIVIGMAADVFGPGSVVPWWACGLFFLMIFFGVLFPTPEPEDPDVAAYTELTKKG